MFFVTSQSLDDSDGGLRGGGGDLVVISLT